jgi:tripartite-type tricarboxylate transporter receptor subunit TctC
MISVAGKNVARSCACHGSGDRLRGRALATFFLALLAPTSGLRADPIEDFYRGRTLQIEVGTGPGGGYDANARLVASHIGEFIPGHPRIVVGNLPGGGGIRAANALFNTLPRDGSVIGTFSNAMITAPLLGAGQALFKPEQFGWIGSASREDGICIATQSAQIHSWSDVQSREIIVGATGPGTTTYMYPTMLRNLFGAKFKLVAGYTDSEQIAFALDHGEVQSVCQTYSSLKVDHSDWFSSGFVTPFLALGFGRLTDFPQLPSATEFAKDEREQQILKTILAPTAAGRPFVAPPGVESDRLHALQKAFTDMTKDPSYVAAAQGERMDVQPASGNDLTQLVQQIYTLPQDVLKETRRVVQDN